MDFRFRWDPCWDAICFLFHLLISCLLSFCLEANIDFFSLWFACHISVSSHCFFTAFPSSDDFCGSLSTAICCTARDRAVWTWLNLELVASSRRSSYVILVYPSGGNSFLFLTLTSWCIEVRHRVQQMWLLSHRTLTVYTACVLHRRHQSCVQVAPGSSWPAILGAETWGDVPSWTDAKPHACYS